MSVTVVGSIAYDAVRTPFGCRQRMLGGAATHPALAASLFEQVRVVGPVGSDFADGDIKVLRTRGTLPTTWKWCPKERRFFWRGEYGWDLNSGETLDRQLGVFEHFLPELSHAAGDCDVLFLANIRAGAAALGARPVQRAAVDRAGLDEPVDRCRSGRPPGGDRAGRLRGAERRRATPADPQAFDRRRGARGAGDGPRRRKRQAGRVRRPAAEHPGLLLAAGAPARARR